MRFLRGPGLSIMAGLLAACGSATPREVGAPEPGARAIEAESDASAGASAAAAKSGADAEAGELSAGLPTKCVMVEDLCLPPRAFVKKLCLDAYTGAAFRLLEASSPYSRGYVRSREVKAVNTLGGPSSDVNLHFGEEVVILTRTGGPGPNQMQVSGMGGHDVLRWDGTCATLSDGELATRAPVPPRYAPFSWKYIDTNIQNALLADKSVETARRNHKKHCHGVSLGRISAACADAEAKLSDSVVAAVRGGISLPVPDRMP
jgi:hypothetical protein